MSTTTTNLGLFKYDPVTDGKETFSIQTALNDNWDILDTKAGSPETVVDGTTWYRRFTDGWKEQGGLVSLSATDIRWPQEDYTPLSANGTMGGTTLACNADTQAGYGSCYPFHAWDSTGWVGSNSSASGNWFVFYFPTPLKVTNISFGAAQGYYTKSFTLKGGDDGSNWTHIGDYTHGNGTISHTIDNSNYYKYYQIKITDFASRTAIGSLVVTAVYQASIANSITFPVAFSNTNYSYTFANQDGGGMDAYVSNKTTTGMTLSNTNSGSASWTACGY